MAEIEKILVTNGDRFMSIPINLITILKSLPNNRTYVRVNFKTLKPQYGEIDSEARTKVLVYILDSDFDFRMWADRPLKTSE